ncbi:hypothetical protein [Actinomadura rugatobispora]|uniref:Protein kinase domain-containing protein n=1 Tax=Actinomadura rugatobispora TaxID=1994 RepID=A0ABW1AC91_9ACTN
MTNFPPVDDYINWLDDTRDCFAPGARFHAAEVEPHTDGLPRGRTGRFGVVFKMTAANQFYALKCFTEPDPDRAGRYRLLTERLAGASMNWVVPVEFDERGIKGWDGRWWPTVTMPWVGGSPLVDWLDDHRGDRAAVERCRMDFARTMASLEDSGLAHGDLQPDNVLVEAGDRIRLIDYDGMFVPGLHNLELRQSGISSFQHPAWPEHGRLGPTMDRFPARLIHLSLLALTYDPGLWTELHTDGSHALFFEADDLSDPGRSERIARLWGIPDATIHRELVQLTKDLRHRTGVMSIPPLDPVYRRLDPLGFVASPRPRATGLPGAGARPGPRTTGAQHRRPPGGTVPAPWSPPAHPTVPGPSTPPRQRRKPHYAFAGVFLALLVLVVLTLIL